MIQKKLTLTEIHQHELAMLKYIDDVCRKNKIEYFLCGGTLIGAIRHQGFIPWDDDVDIYLKRTEYERLLAILKDSSQFKLLSLDSSKDYYYSYAKMVDPTTNVIEANKFNINGYGLFIDIFPLDKCSDNELLRRIALVHQGIVRKLLMTSIQKYSLHKNILKKVIVKATHMVGARKYAERLNKLAQKNSSGSGKKMLDASGALKMNYVLDANWFKGTVNVTFSGLTLQAPKGFQDYLTYSYGDYMTLPPKNQRMTHTLTVTLNDDMGELTNEN